jgi:zinc-finger binding domain of transposase IS66
LVPSAEASAIEVLLPEQCGHCGGSLPQKPDKVTTAGEPRRHQVTEVPPVKAHITEYQFPNVVCGHCGKTTRAPLPRGNSVTYWVTSLTQYALTAVRPPHLPCSRSVPDHLNCYDE